MKMARVPHHPRVSATLIPYPPYQFHYAVISTATDAQNMPVMWTGWRPLPQVLPESRTTHAKNLCPLGSSAAGFSTLRTLLACERRPNPSYQVLRTSSSSTEVNGPSQGPT